MASAIGVTTAYVERRLARLVDHGHVVCRGDRLYELVADPREDQTDDDTESHLWAAHDALVRALDACSRESAARYAVVDAERALSKALDARRA